MTTPTLTHVLIASNAKRRKDELESLMRLRRELRRKRISQWTLAERGGWTESYVWKALNGRRRAPKVIALAKAMLKNGSGAAAAS